MSYIAIHFSKDDFFGAAFVRLVPSALVHLNASSWGDQHGAAVGAPGKRDGAPARRGNAAAR
jgi:hypothetical protein